MNPEIAPRNAVLEWTAVIMKGSGMHPNLMNCISAILAA
jgi:hypothetical protein